MRLEDIGRKISHLWMIFSGMSGERLRRYVGEREEELEGSVKEREGKGKRVSANGLFVFEFLRWRRVASRSSIHGCS